MSDKILTIRLLTPEGILHEGPALAVFLPGTQSPFEVLPGHAPIISALDGGVIRVVTDAEEQRFSIRSGMVKVKDNVVTICAEMA